MSRRGAALLLVLVIVAVGTSAIVAAAVVATTARAKHNVAAATELLDELLASCDGPINWFLDHVADEVTLPPDAQMPEVSILHDRLDGDRSIEVRITAWDLSGMVPWTIARTASPLRSAVPSEVLWTLDSLHLADQSFGLDLVAPSMNMRVFPDASMDDDEVNAKGIEPPAFGTFIATHVSEQARRGRINVNTAPEPLLRAVMRAAGMGGAVEPIMEARERGEHYQIADPAAANPRPTGPQPASSSDGWAFRIDVRIDRVARSWWFVYQRLPVENVENEEAITLEWRCVQRLLIPDGPAFAAGASNREQGEGSDSL